MPRSAEKSIVVFHRNEDIVGIGFLVDKRRVLTCAHVVNDALGIPRQQNPTAEKLKVTFPLIDNHPERKVKVVRWLAPPADGAPVTDVCDIACLELLEEETSPPSAKGVRFTNPLIRADVEVFGYPARPQRPDGGWVPGRLLGRVGNGLLQIDSDRLAALNTQPGYSGSPVVSSGRVMGMLASASILDGQHDCYAIPLGWLRRTWPEAVKTTPAIPPIPPKARRGIVFGAAAVALLVLAGTVVPKVFGSGAASEDCVPLQVSVSTEKAELLAGLAEEYNDAGRTYGDDECATVSTTGLTSGTAMDAIADDWPAETTGQPRPQVWLPTSSMWTDLLRDAGHGDRLTAEESPSVTTSALAIAMPERMAEAMRDDPDDVGWADILELARPGNGWAKVGHPEWGPFVLGRDNPNFSTSGLAATVATYFAATGKQRGITEADLVRGDVGEFVHGIESSVIRYGDDATVFVQDLYEEDRSRSTELPFISAVVMQEQLAYLYNKGAPSGDLGSRGEPPNERLVAVQPKEGTVRLDHPFVVLSSASPEQRAAAADFLAFLVDDAQQRRFVELGFRELDQPQRPTDLLAETVGVPADAEQTFFELPDPPLIKAMQDAWDSTRRQAKVLLLLDVSTSMNDDADPDDSSKATKLEALKPAAKRALALLGDHDEVAIWTFANGVTRPLEMSRVGDVRDRFDGIIDGLATSNNTALHAATTEAHEFMLDTLDQTRINAIVLLSDGENHPADPEGRQRLLDRFTNLETSVRVFTVPYGTDPDRELLDQVADMTNAELYNASNTHDIEEIMVAVFSNFG